MNPNQSIKNNDETAACTAFASAWNRLFIDQLIPMLDEDVIYESQHVLSALEGKQTVVDYLGQKMETVAKHSPGSKVWAELGEVMYRPCVILTQGDKDNLAATVLFTVSNGKIKRIDICSVAPSPHSAKRTGIYPGN